MLRLVAILVLVIGVLSLWPSDRSHKAEAAIINLSATLTNAQEVPPTTPTTSTGTARPASFGSANFVLNDTTPSMTMIVTVFNIDCTGTQTADTNDNLIAAHIHAGITVTPTTNGPVVWGFFGTPFNETSPNDQLVTPFATGVGCTITGKWDAPEGNGTTLAAQVANIKAGNAYINFHTTQFPGGEIRGQILPAVGTADLTATKTSTLTGSGTVNVPFNWTVRIANGGTANAVFNAGNIILTDFLPATNIAYGAVSVTNPTGITNTAAISCGISTNTLICAAFSGGVTIAPGGLFDVTFSATATAAGTFVNPTGGICRVDALTAVLETNEANNDCTNTVVIGTLTPTPTTTVVAPTAVVPPAPVIIPQVFQNPAAIPAIIGGIGNGTRNNTPTPVREVGTAGSTGVGLPPGGSLPALRPPSTGDAGLARGLGNFWSAF